MSTSISDFDAMDFDVRNSDDLDSEDGEQDMDFDSTSGGSDGDDEQSSDGEDSGIRLSTSRSVGDLDLYLWVN